MEHKKNDAVKKTDLAYDRDYEARGIVARIDRMGYVKDTAGIVHIVYRYLTVDAGNGTLPVIDFSFYAMMNGSLPSHGSIPQLKVVDL